MDEYNNLELYIQVDGNSYYVIKYEEEVRWIVSWHEIVRSYFILLDTTKLTYGLRQNRIDIAFHRPY